MGHPQSRLRPENNVFRHCLLLFLDAHSDQVWLFFQDLSAGLCAPLCAPHWTTTREDVSSRDGFSLNRPCGLPPGQPLSDPRKKEA